jgi:spore germination cell wall hydrolase CwlJ-like protein|tara:strand:+ start:447 stop:929 length:483 start_codon:yes stop_codon:yes gene_type:complete
MKFIMIVLLAVFLVSVKSITAKADELSCLAEAVYFEARSEPFVAQLAVANVILTRVDSHRYPDNICDVVHQSKKWKGKPIRNKCQFSYWCDGKPETIANVDAYQQSVSAAELALQGAVLSHTGGATHYHAAYVTPYWSVDEDFMVLGQVGSHIFYVDTRN